MGYKVGIWGQFGPDGEMVADGQAVRTRILFEQLEERYGRGSVYRVNTNNWEKRPWALFANTLKMAIRSDNILILPADNGFKIVVGFLDLTGVVFKKNLIYSVVGGFLPDLLRKHPRYVKMLNKYRTIYAQTPTLVSELQGLGLRNVSFMPNFKKLSCVDERCLRETRQEKIRLCFFSRVYGAKGIEEAVAAVEEANKSLGKDCISLDIYGMVPAFYQERLDELLRLYEGTVRYCGVVDYDKTVEALKDYFAMVFPTHFHGEGFAGCLVDAFAAGLPVIATDWNYNKDLIASGVNGILVPPWDSAALSQAILALYNDRELAYRMAIANLGRAAEYTPEKVLAPLFSLLEDERGGATN